MGSSVNNIVNAQVASGAAIDDTKLAQITTAGKVKLSALTTDSQAEGDIAYASGASSYTRLAKGTDGQVLTLASGLPAWESAVQIVNADITARVDVTGDIPSDDTIPQNTEGTEVGTVTITPKSATSILIIEASIFGYVDGAVVNLALFQDTTANALKAVSYGWAASGANSMASPKLSHYMVSGTTSATTFKIRAGVSAGHMNVNCYDSSHREFGGVAGSFIRVTEHSV